MSSFARNKSEPELFAALQYGSWVGLNVRVGMGSRQYWVQKPRTNAPNPFSMNRVRCPTPPTSTVGADSSVALSAMEAGGRLAFYRAQASNKAYAKLISEVTAARANLALTAVDYKKSLAMVASRAGQLLRAARAMKRLDYNGARKALGLNPERGIQHAKDLPGGRGKSKTKRSNPNRAKHAAGDSANAWLELQFGWLPAIQDIGNAIKVLSNTPPAHTCVGHGRVTFDTGDFFLDGNYQKMKIFGYVGVRHQLRVRCSSPNLLLLHELGFDNPAHVLWDAVPFSFVVDWFVPVGKFLQSWTDFVGLEVIDPFTTTFWHATDSGRNYWEPSYTRSSTAIKVDRTLGVPKFTFPVGIQYRHGLWKQVTETALIVQKLIPALAALDVKSKK